MIVVDIHKKNRIRPEYDVYIGRSLPYLFDKEGMFQKSSKWANPYNKSWSLSHYEEYIRIAIKSNPERYDLNELKNKKLGCWCITTDKLTPLKCHGQILMKLIKEM